MLVWLHSPFAFWFAAAASNIRLCVVPALEPPMFLVEVVVSLALVLFPVVLCNILAAPAIRMFVPRAVPTLVGLGRVVDHRVADVVSNLVFGGPRSSNRPPGISDSVCD